MNVDVVKQSSCTHAYWRHVIASITKQKVLNAGQIVRFTANESTPYFPTFSETPLIMRRFRASKLEVDGNKIRISGIPVSPLEQETEQAANEEPLRDDRIYAVKCFTELKLDGMCRFRMAKANDDGPIVIRFAFVVNDPIKIYDEARRLGIKIVHGKNLTEPYTDYPSEWFEHPPRVRWGPYVIEFNNAPLEQIILRTAYDYPAGLLIKVRDLKGKIDAAMAGSDKSIYDAVYNSVNRINRTVKKQTNKSLLTWENKAFYRNA